MDKPVSDKDLIHAYRMSGDKSALSRLVQRHYKPFYRRFMKYTNQSDQDSRDLCQKLWLNVMTGMDSYQESGRFVHYLNRCSTNLIKDYWASKNRFDYDEIGEIESNTVIDFGEQASFSDGAAGYLIEELLPALPDKYRLPYLLKHESEYWDAEAPFDWEMMGSVNGMSAKLAWSHFESARKKLLDPSHSQDLSELENTIFLLWTQVNRHDKRGRVVEEDLAELMSIPLSTFKTRYRRAVKKLKKGLDVFSLA